MRKVLAVLVFIILFSAPFAMRYFRYYGLPGGTEAEAPPEYDPANIAPVPTPSANEFEDDPEVGNSLVLFDHSHSNDFTDNEIKYLESRLAARGADILRFNGGNLASALRPVDSFVVIAPLSDFDSEEVQAVVEFVNRGGHLLLMGDPTRFDIAFIENDLSFSVEIESDDMPLNSLANEFDIIFNGDYLYNTAFNEGNFQNIILDTGSFGEHELTEELGQVVLYGAHSLTVGDEGRVLFEGDDDTWSSATDRPGGLVLGALSHDDRVLAIGDLNFMTEPYYTVFSNSQFIAGIADFLTAGRDNQVLADFPFFYGDEIKFVYMDDPELGPDAFDEIIALQEAFGNLDRTIELSNEPGNSDALIVGLYNQAEEVTEFLEEMNITLEIDPEIDPDDDEEDEDVVRVIQSDMGSVQMSGTALIMLIDDSGGQQVIVLAASEAGLEATIGRLLGMTSLTGASGLDDCLLQEMMALCPTGISNEPVEAELTTSGIPSTTVGDGGSSGGGDGGTSGGGGNVGEYIAEIDATIQGSIGLGGFESGDLAEAEAHAFIFSDGPETVDIIVGGDDELDAMIIVFDEEYEQIGFMDSTFSGDIEILTMDMPAGASTIVVRDFFNDGGGYTLEVYPSSGDADAGSSEVSDVLVFVDDDGTPAGSGFTSAPAFLSTLPSDINVTTWTSSIDGPLSSDALVDIDLVIWTSGDYVTDAEDFDDVFVILDHVISGGHMLAAGATPAWLTLGGEPLTAPLSSLEVATFDDIIFANLGVGTGDVISLDETHETIIMDEENFSDDLISYLVRASGNAEAGNTVAFGAVDSSGAKIFVLGTPFRSLPGSTQAQWMTNLLAWFES